MKHQQGIFLNRQDYQNLLHPLHLQSLYNQSFQIYLGQDLLQQIIHEFHLKLYLIKIFHQLIDQN